MTLLSDLLVAHADISTRLQMHVSLVNASGRDWQPEDFAKLQTLQAEYAEVTGKIEHHSERHTLEMTEKTVGKRRT